MVQEFGVKIFDVLLDGNKIDRVFYCTEYPITVDEVRHSLVNHDGNDPRITVVEVCKTPLTETHN